jgi:hypothetical protein
MVHSRHGCTASLLKDGRVLFVGGDSDDNTAELYDPTSGTFGAAGPLVHARAWHSSTPLSDGRVLLAGGGDGGDPSTSAELYTPAVVSDL